MKGKQDVDMICRMDQTALTKVERKVALFLKLFVSHHYYYLELCGDFRYLELCGFVWSMMTFNKAVMICKINEWFNI